MSILRKIKCDRCLEDTAAIIMSMFNRDHICMLCKSEEQELPSYERARDADVEAYKLGNKNFEGIGLSPADSEALMQMRAKRVITN